MPGKIRPESHGASERTTWRRTLNDFTVEPLEENGKNGREQEVKRQGSKDQSSGWKIEDFQKTRHPSSQKRRKSVQDDQNEKHSSTDTPGRMKAKRPRIMMATVNRPTSFAWPSQKPHRNFKQGLLLQGLNVPEPVAEGPDESLSPDTAPHDSDLEIEQQGPSAGSEDDMSGVCSSGERTENDVDDAEDSRARLSRLKAALRLKDAATSPSEPSMQHRSEQMDLAERAEEETSDASTEHTERTSETAHGNHSIIATLNFRDWKGQSQTHTITLFYQHYSPKAILVTNIPPDLPLSEIKNILTHFFPASSKIDFARRFLKRSQDVEGKTPKLRLRNLVMLDSFRKLAEQDSTKDSPLDFIASLGETLTGNDSGVFVVFPNSELLAANFSEASRKAPVEISHKPRSLLDILRDVDTFTRPAMRDLESVVNANMRQFTKEETKLLSDHSRSMRAGTDPDGFTTIVTGNEPMKADEVARGIGVVKDPKTKADFYRFQLNEKRQAEINQLKKKFADDKSRIARMKANRQFKGY